MCLGLGSGMNSLEIFTPNLVCCHRLAACWPPLAFPIASSGQHMQVKGAGLTPVVHDSGGYTHSHSLLLTLRIAWLLKYT